MGLIMQRGHLHYVHGPSAEKLYLSDVGPQQRGYMPTAESGPESLFVNGDPHMREVVVAADIQVNEECESTLCVLHNYTYALESKSINHRSLNGECT